jgi:hypothetical protein
MTLRIVSFVATFAIFLASTANAQFLAKDTAAGDSQQDFAKRLASIKNDALSSSVREAEKLGWNLYRYEVLGDLAGSVLAQQTPPAIRAAISGAVVVPNNAGWCVRFYSVSDKGVCKPVADVAFDGNQNPVVTTGKALTEFSARELSLIHAKLLVDSQKEDPCQGNYKMIALPAASGDGIWVYQIRQIFDETHFPEGQHIRYEISSDGTRILSQRDFSRRCNVLPVQNSADIVSTEIKLTNTMDPQPNELHIYLSLRYNAKIFLGTMQSNLYWWVKSGVVTPD